MASQRSQQSLSRCLGVALVWLAVLAQPRTGFAQETAPDEASQARDQEARRLFEAGRAAYVEEKYQDALNYFQQAHELSGRPQLLFNIGQAADRAGQRETAAQAFRDYLAAVPDAENREEVETRIAELESSESDVSTSTLTVGADADADQAQGRDALYLRGALGLGVFSDAFNHNLGELKGTYAGGTLAGEIAVGFAIKPGLALAGFAAMEWGQAREITVGDVTFKDESVGVLLMLGAMADWYLNPSKGWHLQGGLALSRLSVQGGESGVIDHSPVGGALVLGGGYEWRLKTGISLGVLGRATATQLKGDEYTHNVVALSLLCSATMF